MLLCDDFRAQDSEPASHVRLRVAPVAVDVPPASNDLAPAAVAEEEQVAPPAGRSADEELKAMLPMVETEVARFLRRLPRSVLKDDLVSAGMIGLLDALRRSTGPRDARFDHYARTRVRGAIVDELRRQDWLSRSDRAKERAATSSTNVVHMEDLCDGGAEAASHEETPADAVAQRMRWNAVLSAMNGLPPREREILDMLYVRGWMLKDIARAMKVSQPRISQLHAQAVGRLRAALEGWNEPMSNVHAPTRMAG